MTAELLYRADGWTSDDDRVHRLQGKPDRCSCAGDRAAACPRHRDDLFPLCDRRRATPHRHPVTRDLVTAEPQVRIGDVMTEEVLSVSTDTDQEKVARTIQRYDFLAVPVVDLEQRLVGIVTVDDDDEIAQEATVISTPPLVQAGDDDDYFSSNLFTVARRRVVWLAVLVLASFFTSEVIAANEDVLQRVVLLAAFIPLLGGTGGNVGAQSSTVVIEV